MFDIWRTHNFVALLILTAVVALTVRKRYGALVGLSWLYLAGSAVFLFANPSPTWGELQPRIDATSGLSYAIIMSMTLVVTRINHVTRIFSWLSFIASIEMALIFYRGYGIFNSASAGVTFAALLVPYCLFQLTGPIHYSKLNRFGAYAFLAQFVLILCGNQAGSTPYFVLVGMIAATLLHQMNLKFLLVGASLLALGMVKNASTFLDSNGRSAAWRLLMQWWADHGNPWVGTGTGSFEWLALAAQAGHRFPFLFMHNEYLQILFEQGIIGLTLFMAVWSMLAYRAARLPTYWEWQTLAGISVAMLTQFPFRYMISMALVVALGADLLHGHSRKNVEAV